MNLALMRLIDKQFQDNPVPWRPADVRAPAQRGPCRERKAHPAADAGLPETRRQQAREGPQDLPLGGLRIDRPDQVWRSDIACIPMRRGFLHLVAITDWFTRKALAWRISTYDRFHLRARDAGSQARAGAGRWITFHNHRRPHAAHGGQPPAVACVNSIENQSAGAGGGLTQPEIRQGGGAQRGLACDLRITRPVNQRKGVRAMPPRTVPGC